MKKIILIFMLALGVSMKANAQEGVPYFSVYAGTPTYIGGELGWFTSDYTSLALFWDFCGEAQFEDGEYTPLTMYGVKYKFNTSGDAPVNGFFGVGMAYGVASGDEYQYYSYYERRPSEVVFAAYAGLDVMLSEGFGLRAEVSPQYHNPIYGGIQGGFKLAAYVGIVIRFNN